MIKKENSNYRKRRVDCQIHGEPIKYKCETPGCSNVFLCSHPECLEEHFHNEAKLVLSRFDSKLWDSKLQEAENVLGNNALRLKEEELTRIVGFFTSSLSKIHQQMQHFQQTREELTSSELALHPSYFDKVNSFLCLGSKIERKLDQLRAKIVDDDLHDLTTPLPDSEPLALPAPSSRPIEQEVNSPIEQSHKSAPHEQIIPVEQEEQVLSLPKRHCEYYENKELTRFLRKYVRGFNWEECEEIFSSKTHLTTCEKFHEKLKDRRSLLFFFVGFNNKIIGSYYEEPYPSVAEKNRKDVHSFIFIDDDQVEEKFAVFTANPDHESHISVSDKLLICQGNTPNSGDGLRTFQRNFESLAYFLPSLSYHSTLPERDVIYNGIHKIKEFYILQVRH